MLTALMNFLRKYFNWGIYDHEIDLTPPTMPEKPGDSTDGDTVYAPNLPPEPVITESTPKSLLTKFCLQIQGYEGYIPPCTQYPTGTAAWRNKNPGNLRWNDQPFAIGKSASGFAIFDTYEHGFQALEDLVVYVAQGKSKIYGLNPTIDSFFSVYAPESDNNVPKRYALTVATRLGLSPSTHLRDFIGV